MVSRRTYFIITLMMAVLFFLFVSLGVAKEGLNEFDTNQYAEDSVLTMDSMWKPSKDMPADIILISKKDSKVCGTVRQWCEYSKNKLEIYKKLGNYDLPERNMPKLVLLDSESVNFDRDMYAIQKLVDNNVHVVFCNLPDFSVVKDNYKLQRFLGIDVVDVESVRIKGISVYKGFLLGKEKIYMADEDDKEELKLQDFKLDIPWYQTKSGTKTYMAGMLEPDEVQNEFMPGIIWRNSIGESMIFAVNGDFISTDAGIGILSSILYESQPYYMYPIANAQNLVFTNFCGFSQENTEEMMTIYSRSQISIAKELIWPSLAAISQRNLNKMTCFYCLQYDYDDMNEPLISEYRYFMKVLNEENAEAGLSTARLDSDMSVADKLERDRLFLVDNNNSYKYCAYYAGKDDIEGVARLAGTNQAGEMKTITTEFEENEKLFDYMDDDLTLQRATIDGYSHSYLEDFRVMSLETALGYSNIMTDMGRIAWPKYAKDRWEIMAEYFSKYTDTYWKDYKCYDQTTISESDRRIRKLLAIDYDIERQDNTLSVDIRNIEDVSWFILRTHSEDVLGIEGGSFTKIEEDAYIIRADTQHLDIELGQSGAPVYYD